jgi:hypothetical protein
MTRFPFLFRLLPLALAFAFFAALATDQPDTIEAIQIEPVVWTAKEDYPSDVALYSDTQVPVQTVYLKTHDVGDWMSRYDKTPFAISGVSALHARVREYNQLGIEVIAWFVPGRDPDVDPQADIDRQLAMAKLVLDSGVKGFYADVEPFDGFCNWDCRWSAENFWLRLRAERPDAHLGVIYDPRPHHWEQSATNVWLSVADVALPMCYWETFVDQPPWNDPRGCVRGAYQDLGTLAPGRPLEYVPMIQGDSTPELVRAAVEESQALGSKRVSIWRRGVTAPAVWDAIRPLADPVTPICARTLADGCLLRENSSPNVWAMYGGARYYIPTGESFAAMGYDPNGLSLVPDGFLENVPTAPPDGTILQELGSQDRYLILAGARFPATDESLAALGTESGPVQTVPPGSIPHVTPVPRDNSWLKELNSGREWFVTAGARFPIESPEARDALIAGGHMSSEVVVVPQNSLGRVPFVPADHTRLRALGDPTVWQIAAGARFAVDGPEVLESLVNGGHLLRDEVIIPEGGLALIAATPPEGTLLRADGDPRVYQVAVAERWWVENPESLQRLIDAGAVNPTVHVIARDGLEQLPLGRDRIAP